MDGEYKRFTARTISTLFVPPSFALILFPLLTYKFDSTANQHLITILVTLTFGFFFHIALFVYLRKKGRVVDVDATIKEERTFPFIISVLFYIMGLLILLKTGINIISVAFWFCYISNTILILFINRFWKISAHMMGASGPAAVILFVFGLPGLLFLLLLAAIGWARIYLKCHDLKQVLAGGVLGFGFTFIQLELITKYFNA